MAAWTLENESTRNLTHPAADSDSESTTVNPRPDISDLAAKVNLRFLDIYLFIYNACLGSIVVNKSIHSAAGLLNDKNYSHEHI